MKAKRAKSTETIIQIKKANGIKWNYYIKISMFLIMIFHGSSLILSMDRSSLTGLKRRIEAAHFSDEKLSTIRTAASNATFTAAQVAELMDLFNYSEEKLKALQVLRTRIEDPANAFVIVERFTFSGDKSQAASLLEGIESALPKPPSYKSRTICWGNGPGRFCYTEYYQE